VKNTDVKLFTHWFPNSDATKRNPVFSTHMAAATGTVSKYFSRISVTWKQRKMWLCKQSTGVVHVRFNKKQAA